MDEKDKTIKRQAERIRAQDRLIAELRKYLMEMLSDIKK